MSLEELKKESKELDYQIEKLEEFLGKKKEKEVSFGEYAINGIEVLPEILPAAFIPALMGAELYGEVIDSNLSTPKKVALCALNSVIAIPCFALTLIVTLPIAAITVPTSLIMGGVQSSHAAARNARVKKARNKLASLRERRKELDKELSNTTTR